MLLIYYYLCPWEQRVQSEFKRRISVNWPKNEKKQFPILTKHKKVNHFDNLFSSFLSMHSDSHGLHRGDKVSFLPFFNQFPFDEEKFEVFTRFWESNCQLVLLHSYRNQKYCRKFCAEAHTHTQTHSRQEFAKKKEINFILHKNGEKKNKKWKITKIIII